MPVAKVTTGAIVGLDPVPITVEVNVEKRGFPAFNIVGLPNKGVDESKLRIRSAIINSDLKFPNNKITVNLAPANIPKEGSFYDLPITIGILKATNQIRANINQKVFMGELSLDGYIKEAPGVPIVGCMVEESTKSFFYLPLKNKEETRFLENVFCRFPNDLKSLVDHLEGIKLLPLVHKFEKEEQIDLPEIIFEDIKEQEHAKRAVIIAAAGNHNLALTGPPGTGKSMISKAMISILPSLSNEEKKEVMKIHSIVDNSNLNRTYRPFRSPHHTVSRIGLIGGGTKVKPGEITLAHRGILFMDEFNEYPRSVIEALRQPIEDRKISISRASGSTTFPASFTLVVANNPCPCGYFNSNFKECICKSSEIVRYQKRVSGPIWDRIDLFVDMKEFDVKKMGLEKSKNKNYGQETAKYKALIEKTRKIQNERYKENTYKTNGEQSNKIIIQKAKMTKKAKIMLDNSANTLGLSPRGYFKTIKVARTIADLEESKQIKQRHILEALSFRKQGN